MSLVRTSHTVRRLFKRLRHSTVIKISWRTLVAESRDFKFARDELAVGNNMMDFVHNCNTEIFDRRRAKSKVT